MEYKSNIDYYYWKKLPWIEKYRPNKLNNLIGQKHIVRTLKVFIYNDNLPNMLFYGIPGIGKTSAILACAREIYGEFTDVMTMEKNASNDRGIITIRQDIKTFASTKNLYNFKHKLVILDEADSMTPEAQSALRVVMEKYIHNVRFCLICNQSSKIIPSIQSRCTRFRFKPVSDSDNALFLKKIIKHENINCTNDGINNIIKISNGDLRKSLNILYTLSKNLDEINKDNTYLFLAYPNRDDILTMISYMFNKNFIQSYTYIVDIINKKKLLLYDIIHNIHHYIEKEIKLPLKVKMFLYNSLADIEFRLSFDTSEKIQIGSLVSYFQIAKTYF